MIQTCKTPTIQKDNYFNESLLLSVFAVKK